jgi:hypothetical protein
LYSNFYQDRKNELNASAQNPMIKISTPIVEEKKVPQQSKIIVDNNFYEDIVKTDIERSLDEIMNDQ